MQVPFFRFLSVGPLKIGNFDRALQRFCRFFGILGLGRTGKQLFVLDRRRARDPLVVCVSALDLCLTMGSPSRPVSSGQCIMYHTLAIKYVGPG